MVLLKCDLHVHTNASRDGESSVEDVLAAAVKAGLDAIAITDHDTTEGSLCALAAQNPGVLIIPGIEVSTRQGHLLVLGTTKVLAPKQDVLKTGKSPRGSNHCSPPIPPMAARSRPPVQRCVAGSRCR